jgi:glycosyltransferase involved in cell wall biosynthesis
MEKIVVLHVTQAMGGVKTFLENLIGHSTGSFIIHIVLAPEDREFDDFCKTHDIQYFPVKIGRGINPFSDFGALWTITRHIKRLKPDVIHTHSAKGGFLGRLAGRLTRRPVLYTPHAFSYLPFTGFRRTVFYSLERIARKWTRLLVAVSASEANRAIFEVGFNTEKVRVVMNSINVDNVSPRKDYSHATRVRMIGRLTHQKNPLLFLKIANKLSKLYPEVQFAILGAGLHDHLIREIREYMAEHQLDAKVSLEQWGDHSTSEAFINSTDVFVMTSVFEGLPYSLLEAMAKGIPCVTSKADGNADVIQNGENGFACITEDEYCEKIGRLLENEALREAIGCAGLEYVIRHHNIKDAVVKFEEIYASVARAAKKD